MSAAPRSQFTFYRSFFEAIHSLPKKERLAAYEAVCAYALDGTEPQLTGTGATAFILIRPTLDTAHRRAISGKLGGEQNGSKAEAK